MPRPYDHRQAIDKQGFLQQPLNGKVGPQRAHDQINLGIAQFGNQCIVGAVHHRDLQAWHLLHDTVDRHRQQRPHRKRQGANGQPPRHLARQGGQHLVSLRQFSIEQFAAMDGLCTPLRQAQTMLTTAREEFFATEMFRLHQTLVNRRLAHTQALGRHCF